MGNLNNKWINLVFCIDSSGSMSGSESDVVGGFRGVIDEQKENKDGKVTVSLYTFSDKVQEKYLGVDINDIGEFTYRPFGCTAMNDGIGTAIDSVGKWLYERDIKGDEMPGKTLFVVMTDGQENASVEYTLKQVKDKIREQTDKYSWEFIYMGTDITTSKDSDELGFKHSTYSSKSKLSSNYNVVNQATTAYRCAATRGFSLVELDGVMEATLQAEAAANTSEFEKEIGAKIK